MVGKRGLEFGEKVTVYIGFDPREAPAFMVAKHSILERPGRIKHVWGLVLDAFRRSGLYTRETTKRNGVLWDVISDAPMSTEFAISRFLVPVIQREGWALFTDSDVMARRSLDYLFDLCDHEKAVMCVQHGVLPELGKKMDGQVQLPYNRKNWSSVMLFNCSHPANKRLTLEMVNTLPGRDLHRFCWLEDSEIGALPLEWNFLVGHHSIDDLDAPPAIVHFTDGYPLMAGYEDCEFAEEWREQLLSAAVGARGGIEPWVGLLEKRREAAT